jgi:hypothetical protein
VDVNTSGTTGQQRVRFRQSFAALAAVIIAATGSVAIAGQAWRYTPVLVIPLAALWWVLRSVVDVDHETLRIRGPLRTRVLRWPDVTGFAVARGRVRAQLTDAAGGTAVRLPAVTPNTLPRVLAAGGRALVATASPDGPASTGAAADGPDAGEPR